MGEVSLTAGIGCVVMQVLFAILSRDVAFSQQNSKFEFTHSREFTGFPKGKDTLRVKTDCQLIFLIIVCL